MQEGSLDHKLVRATVCESLPVILSETDGFTVNGDDLCTATGSVHVSTMSEYQTEMGKLGTWGGEVEARAAASAYAVTVMVYTDHRPEPYVYSAS